MKNLVAVAGLAASLLVVADPVSAKGCLTGAAVGGVAGHVAGHHGVIGAAAGCAINHHRNTVKDRNAAAAAAQPAQPAQSAAPATAAPAAAAAPATTRP